MDRFEGIWRRGAVQAVVNTVAGNAGAIVLDKNRNSTGGAISTRILLPGPIWTFPQSYRRKSKTWTCAAMIQGEIYRHSAFANIPMLLHRSAVGAAEVKLTTRNLPNWGPAGGDVLGSECVAGRS